MEYTILLTMLKSAKAVTELLPDAKEALGFIYEGLYALMSFYELAYLSHQGFFEICQYKWDNNYADTLNDEQLLNLLLSFTTVNIYKPGKISCTLGDAINNRDLKFIYNLIYQSREKNFDGLLDDNFVYSKAKLLEVFIANKVIVAG